MFIVLRKPSLWIALFGVIFVIYMVRKTTGLEPMPPPASAPAQKPSAHVIAAAGMVEALRENTSVGVPVSALVKQVFVTVWDRVEAGTPLLQLDDRELQARLQAEKAEVIVREAELIKASRQHKRAELLRASQGVSVEEAETRRDEFSVAQARLSSAQAMIVQTAALIDRLTVRSPIRGTILQVNIRVGEYATSAGDTNLLLLGSVEEMQVRADVDEQIAPRVKPGSKAVGYLRGDSQNPITMEFVRIEPFVTPKRNLTGSSSERVDTRVLQVVYKFSSQLARRVYVGQQMDLFIEE